MLEFFCVTSIQFQPQVKNPRRIKALARPWMLFCACRFFKSKEEFPRHSGKLLSVDQLGLMPGVFMSAHQSAIVYYKNGIFGSYSAFAYLRCVLSVLD